VSRNYLKYFGLSFEKKNVNFFEEVKKFKKVTSELIHLKPSDEKECEKVLNIYGI
jgi:hypothetical protein